MVANRKNLGRKPTKPKVAAKPKAQYTNPRKEALEEIKNLLFTWIEECLDVVPGVIHTSNRTLYESYRAWMKEQLPEYQPYALTPIRWGIGMRVIGHPSTKFGGEKVRWGLVLKK